MVSTHDGLLDRAVGGDGEALAALLERHGQRVRRQLKGQIPQRWQGILSLDDVMQQTYQDAFLDVACLEPRGEAAFVAWLLTLARRNLLDALRMLDAEKRGKQWRRLRPRPDDDSLAFLAERLGCVKSTPSRRAARHEARACLEQAIARLPPAYRIVVQMYDLAGRSVVDVAALLNRSPGAVFMLRARAHRYLQKILGTGSRYLSDTA
jgi:RNA polymerase sigma-70 factor (ECF subfamily)